MCKTLINSVFVLLVLCLAMGVQAVETHWNDTGADQLFSNPANWNTGAPPSPNDTAVIVRSGEYAVTLDTDASVAALVLTPSCCSGAYCLR